METKPNQNPETVMKTLENFYGKHFQFTASESCSGFAKNSKCNRYCTRRSNALTSWNSALQCGFEQLHFLGTTARKRLVNTGKSLDSSKLARLRFLWVDLFLWCSTGGISWSDSTSTSGKAALLSSTTIYHHHLIKLQLQEARKPTAF